MPSSHIFQAARLKPGKASIIQELDLHLVTHKMVPCASSTWIPFSISLFFFPACIPCYTYLTLLLSYHFSQAAAGDAL